MWSVFSVHVRKDLDAGINAVLLPLYSPGQNAGGYEITYQIAGKPTEIRNEFLLLVNFQV